MGRARKVKYWSDYSIYEPAKPAVEVLAKATGLSPREARQGLIQLIQSGYVVAPRAPTNAMLLAYIESYGDRPAHPTTVITAIGKAVVRWKAMCEAGAKVAVSVKRLAPDPHGERE